MHPIVYSYLWGNDQDEVAMTTEDVFLSKRSKAVLHSYHQAPHADWFPVKGYYGLYQAYPDRGPRVATTSEETMVQFLLTGEIDA
jgi:hypothetical protein